MSIAILEQSLGPVLLALSVPQPAVEQVGIVVAMPSGFDLARFGQGSSADFATKPGLRGLVHFPDELPFVLADDAPPPPAITWYPTGWSFLRIAPTKVRYSLHF